MAQIGWIHDVKMDDFGAAAAKLARAGRDSLEVDQARTMLSLSKLAFIAVEPQDAANDDTAQEAHSRLEDALEICQIQENLSQYFTAMIRSNRDHASELVWRHRDDVSDKKAVLDAAMLITTSNCRHDFPALYIVYNELVRCIWNGHMLSVEDLVDVLTFPDNMICIDGSSTEDAEQCNALVRERYSLAVDILSRASINLSEQTREATLRTIWRRVFLSDDWPAIHQRIGVNVPDSKLRQELECTRLYNVLQSCLTVRELAHPDWYLLPIDSFATSDLDYLASRLAPRFSSDGTPGSEWKPLSATTSPAIQKDYSAEDNRLRAAIKCNLGSYYSEILRIVTDQIAYPTRSTNGNSSDMDAQASTEDDNMMEFD
ncbi:hypothetical protein IWW36_004501 [Coemansia brasiliensis]|uniref:Nucleoporin Nup133/Nup155-like C-terminal domain-containing protein n=1 Tax=Coemansia brasiliensis TaxID=2650707 RepID=A0A9W8I5T7_9FUNG|nr:hypothetical protein IWW36_004501 [Coemansia brasiliensis]